MRAAIPAVVAMLAVAGSAAVVAAGRTGAAIGDPCAAPLTGGTRTLAFSSGGARRTARLDAPAAAAGRRVPLVVALHYAGGSGSRMAAVTRLSPSALEAGFAVVYPTATKADRVWRLRDDAGGRAEVRLVANLLDAVHGAACVDAGRTFATGVSNGGGMAARLACALADRFAAVAPVAPGLRAVTPCTAGPPVGVLEVHGLRDAVVPYAGRGPAHAGSVPRWLALWRRRNGCEAGARVRVSGRRGARVFRTTWPGCRAAVEAIALEGTGHGWPGARRTVAWEDPTGLDATREVLRFFARFPPVTGSPG